MQSKCYYVIVITIVHARFSENQHRLCLVNAYLPVIVSQMTVWTR